MKLHKIDFLIKNISKSKRFQLNGRTLIWLIFKCLLKETKIDIPVIPVFNKVGMLVEIVFRGMLQHKKSIFFQEFFGKNQIGYLGKLNQFIGRIGKDHIELRVAGIDKFEDIGFNQR